MIYDYNALPNRTNASIVRLGGGATRRRARAGSEALVQVPAR